MFKRRWFLKNMILNVDLKLISYLKIRHGNDYRWVQSVLQASQISSKQLWSTNIRTACIEFHLLFLLFTTLLLPCSLHFILLYAIDCCCWNPLSAKDSMNAWGERHTIILTKENWSSTLTSLTFVSLPFPIPSNWIQWLKIEFYFR